MNITEVLRVRGYLEKFLEPYQKLIGRAERVHNCRMYLSGLLLNGERKSIQPIAERLPGGNEQNMQQFVNQSPWDHKPVMKKLWEGMAAWGGNSKGVLALDDTTLPKKGDASVGVAAHEGSTLVVCLNSLRLLFARLPAKTGAPPAEPDRG